MEPTRMRNQQIVEMQQQGVLRRDIARHFGLTPGRIGSIVKEAETERFLAERRARLRAEIGATDDLDKPWAVVDLIDALWLIVIARTGLHAHFQRIQQAQMSLRELMDLAISVTGAAGPGEVSTPLLHIRGIGKYGFYSVVAELTEMDLGRQCNEEWRNRLAKLRRHWKIPSWPPNPRRKIEG